MIPGRYMFGVVVIADADGARAPMPHANMLYIFDFASDEPIPSGTHLHSNNLLIPPLWTNRTCWSEGYFRTIDSLDALPSIILSHHCFRALNPLGGTDYFVDEFGRRIPEARGWCGTWAMASYRGVAARIGDALGIAPAPGGDALSH